jgi:hypothetical protein
MGLIGSDTRLLVVTWSKLPAERPVSRMSRPVVLLSLVRAPAQPPQHAYFGSRSHTPSNRCLRFERRVAAPPARLAPVLLARLWTDQTCTGKLASASPIAPRIRLSDWFQPAAHGGGRVRCVLPKQWAMADAPSNTDRRPSSPRGKASSEASGYAGVFQAHRQSPILGSVQSAPEVRALSSASITRPQRSYGPLRLPSDPPPVRRWGCQPPSGRVSPDDPHHPSNVPCPVPRRIEAGACVDCFPAHTAFPVSQAGRHPHLHFRGLLRLHARYGPLDGSTAHGGLCHEASTRPVARPGRSSATRSIDNSLGGTFLHW